MGGKGSFQRLFYAVYQTIKAANVLIRSDGHIVLADFGLAKD